MTNTYRKVTDHIYKTSNGKYRVRFQKNKKKYSRVFQLRRDAVSWKIEQLSAASV